MKKLRILIADDEEPARRAMKRALGSIEDVEIVGEAANGFEVLELAREFVPDAVFLDIRMPGMDGLEAARSLMGDSGPAVVFVTAFNEYAVEAFEREALDYIVKPVRPERVRRSVERLRLHGAVKLGETALSALRAPESEQGVSSLVRVGGSLRPLDSASITFVEAAGNYVRVHCADSTLLVRETLSSVVTGAGGELIRVHRSYAIRPSEVVELQRNAGADPIAKLRGGQKVPVGRTYWKELKARLGS